MLDRLALVIVVAPLAVLAACTSQQTSENGDPAADPKPGTLAYDQSVFHALLDDHTKIRRTVTLRPDGAEALTESDDPQVAALLKDHVNAMKGRLHTGRRVRQWDPLYIAMFDHADKVHLEITPTEQGVRVTETSSDLQVAALIQAHAATVSGFVATGTEEAAKSHPVPSSPR